MIIMGFQVRCVREHYYFGFADVDAKTIVIVLK